ncbi:MAG TPA: CAP domain-containing protein, partial [Acidimicrobiales bacterium]|nr:CAP domain-containing protein [Acidimicrobiales bacterium]
MSRSRIRWWGVAMVAAVATVALGVLPAQADAGDAGRLLTLTNQVRAGKGLPALAVDSKLTAVAQAWAAELAGRGVISHNPSLRSQVSGWKVVGENVGVGGAVDAVHAGFVASPT